jgi:hypothetical protein
MRHHAFTPDHSRHPDITDLISIAQVTREFGISRATLYRYAKIGLSRQPGRLLPLVWVGGRTFVSRAELTEYLIRPVARGGVSVKAASIRKVPTTASTARIDRFLSHGSRSPRG